MKRIFISQPMRDKTDEEIMKTREEAVRIAKNILKDDVMIIPSFFQGAPHDATPLWFLGESLKLLSTADAAYFVDGWEGYRGCCMEHEAAEKYGIPIIP